MDITMEEETAFLNRVTDKLKDAVEELDGVLAGKKQEIVSMKKYFWENLNEFDEYGYEHYTNHQMIQAEQDYTDERFHKKMMYEKMMKSPYFARIDFLYEGDDEPEPYYIGIGSFYPKKAALPLIYDWRAPVSGLFYDFNRGTASYDAPMGTLNGEITRKVQYKIEDGKLLYLFENDMKIDDDILQKELALHANAKLKNIVATIQKEQNAVIRNNTDRILVVQGSAGSGKTSIALHRIAYLLYHKRKELSSQNVMILSPNSVFSDYISTILPELGEENIVEMSLDAYAASELKEIASFESRYSQLEYLLKDAENEEIVAEKKSRIQYKKSKEFIEHLRKFIEECPHQIMQMKDLTFKKISRSKTEIEELFFVKYADIPLLKRMEYVASYIIDEEETLNGKEMDPIEAGIVTDRLMAMYQTRNELLIYSRFLLSEKLPVIDCNNRFVEYEDVYPLLYAKFLLNGKAVNRRIRHLVIDEMQDYSYVQFALIHKLFDCPMTILGDKNQVMEEKDGDVIPMIKSIFGEEIKTVVLNKSYRSTYQIAAFAGNVIKQKDAEYFNRQGEIPKMISVPNKNQMASQLRRCLQAEEGKFDTIAVLCKTKKEAAALYEELSKYIPVTLQDEDSDSFEKGIVIMTFYLAKGLEFDSVHIPNADEATYHSMLDRQALYISCTRALHKLTLYADSFTSFLEDEEGSEESK